MKKIYALVFVTMLLATVMPLGTAAASATPTGESVSGTISGVSHPQITRPSDAEDIPGLDASSFLQNAVADGIVPQLTPHSPWSVAVSDDYMGGFYYLDFQQVLSGEHCNIWVGLSTSVWHAGYQDEWVTNGPGLEDDIFYFAYPWSSVGGAFWGAPRLQPGYRDYIFGSQLIEIMNAFDSNIWGKDTSFFGMYKDRPGPLGDYKVQILVFNIRDGLFWDPETAPYFIEGYFWDYISNLYNSNIIHIDTYQWFRRQGPAPSGGDPAYFVNPIYPVASRFPYEYEGTFAHEFEHLIHNDIDGDEYLWVNEGCAELAQIICGYGFPSGHLANYIAYFWDTSLVVWEGSLANYGAAGLWTYYMYEHYGGQKFIYAIVHEQANGIAGYNNVLRAFCCRKNFDAIFQDWAIANYLDDTSFARGIYGYYGLDFGGTATQGWSIPYSISYWGTYDEVYPTGWALPERLPYIVWYWEFYNGAPQLKVYFNGDDYAGVFPYSPTHEWYSDGTAYSWFRLGQTFAIPTTGATLKFWSNYGIEENWDYGYVEVHDLSTGEWYTLPGLYTISTILNPEDNPNTPDEFEPTTYLAAGRWNAFTGSSDGWYQETMDLTPFAGHDIEVFFTYWTDPYTLGNGWYIDDIEIPEIGFFDNVENGANGWTVTGNWAVTTGIIENTFKVNFIEAFYLNRYGKESALYLINPMRLNHETEEGKENLLMIQNKFISTWAVMIVASQPGYEHTWPTGFYFLVDSVPFCFIHHWFHC